MQRYFAAATLIMLIVLVISRTIMMKKRGVEAFKFGELDKKDFLIPPFVLLYFYVVFASALDGPKIGAELFASRTLSWVGVVLCMLGLVVFLLSLIAFGRSFRVGIDEDHPGPLVTSGVFSLSRNPIYAGFIAVFIGIFLIIPNWIILLYLIAGIWLINRQILREEVSLKRIYGDAYAAYCKKVRRYF